MKCKNCQIEYKPIRRTGQFCSPKCRKEFWSKNAKGVSVQNGKVSVLKISVPVEEKKTDNIGQEKTDTINKWGKNVKEMDAKTLYEYIGAYEGDTWKESPEYKELARRLKTYMPKRLREEGYWIPNRLEPYTGK